MIECTYEAVYSDGKYQVEWDEISGNTYLVATDGSLIPVPYYLANGARFIEYKCIGIAGLTEGSFCEQDSLMRKRLRAPKPTAPPVLEAQDDEAAAGIPKFSCQRREGENSFVYLQRVQAEKNVWERTVRAQARRSHMAEASIPDPRKLAEAQQARALGLAEKKPRGGGGGFETTKES
jgi:hypothetical protein